MLLVYSLHVCVHICACLMAVRDIPVRHTNMYRVCMLKWSSRFFGAHVGVMLVSWPVFTVNLELKTGSKTETIAVNMYVYTYVLCKHFCT